MIKVKLVDTLKNYKFIRQSPNNNGIWGNYKFYENENVDQYDYYVVFNNLPEKDIVNCPKGRTILITAESKSNLYYHPKFLNQFGTIISCQDKLKHSNVINKQQSLPWHIGISKKNTIKHHVTQVNLDYDKLQQMEVPNKDRLLSVITSNKKYTKGHKLRINFVKKLKEHFGQKLDVFGIGINYVEDKWDALENYKYHIALENSYHKDYWTEKLSDPILAYSYPFYYGCPNIDDYFHQNSLTKIDISNPKKSIKVIENGMNEDLYEKRFEKMKKNRELVLDRYNLFPFIINIIEKYIDDSDFYDRNKFEILPHQHFQNTSYKIKNKIKKMI